MGGTYKALDVQLQRLVTDRLKTSRYLSYPQSDLSAAPDQIASMRAEMDRMYDSTFGSSLRSPAPLSRWNPAVNVYQDKDQFILVAELPGLKKEEIDISLHDDTLTISGGRKREGSSEQGLLTKGSIETAFCRLCYRKRRKQSQNRSKSPSNENAWCRCAQRVGAETWIKQ